MPSRIIQRDCNTCFTFMYFTYLKVGLDKGSTYFRMADVNLAFTSPNKLINYALRIY